MERRSAEFFVVDQLGHRRRIATERAAGISPNLHRAEVHRQRVVEQQPILQRLALLQEDFDRLSRLDRADRPGSTPKTPASEHDGTMPGGGGDGYRHR